MTVADLPAPSMTDVEIRARLAIAITEVALYARLATARGMRVTLDLVERESPVRGDHYTVVIWSEGQ